jgi:hypothetical protein
LLVIVSAAGRGGRGRRRKRKDLLKETMGPGVIMTRVRLISRGPLACQHHLPTAARTPYRIRPALTLRCVCLLAPANSFRAIAGIFWRLLPFLLLAVAVAVAVCLAALAAGRRGPGPPQIRIQKAADIILIPAAVERRSRVEPVGPRDVCIVRTLFRSKPHALDHRCVDQCSVLPHTLASLKIEERIVVEVARAQGYAPLGYPVKQREGHVVHH